MANQLGLFSRLGRVFLADPRHGQIAALGSLLIYGIFWRGFGVTLPIVGLILGVALTTQLLGETFLRWQSGKALSWAFDPKSALVTSMSLSLLLRADSVLIIALGAFLAIGSKFLVRTKAGHIFNPANFAIVVLLLMLPSAVWVSPGQWGTGPFLAAAILFAGSLVLARSGRIDTAITFLAVYASLLFWRAFWLGDPLAIPLHQLQSGAILLFTCFMITDPKTTPASRNARVLFAAGVALLAYYLQFKLFIPEGLFFALFAFCLLKPAFDFILPGSAYRWGAAPALIQFGGRK